MLTKRSTTGTMPGYNRPGAHSKEAGRRRYRVTNTQIARHLVGKGWEIRYRGGNSVCSTPSDLDLVVADAPGDPPRYSIAAWPSGAGPRADAGSSWTSTTPIGGRRAGAPRSHARAGGAAARPVRRAGQRGRRRSRARSADGTERGGGAGPSPAGRGFGGAIMSVRSIVAVARSMLANRTHRRDTEARGGFPGVASSGCVRPMHRSVRRAAGVPYRPGRATMCRDL